MAVRSEFLQIRVTPAEKVALKRLARASGQDLSSYVLARAIPSARLRFEELLGLLASDRDYRFALAELNDLLSGLAPAELRDTVAVADLTMLSPLLRNYTAAMVEQASHLKNVPPPVWASQVAPLEEPHFAAPLKALRLHLLRAAPVPFRRRNIFIDASVGARV